MEQRPREICPTCRGLLFEKPRIFTQRGVAKQSDCTHTARALHLHRDYGPRTDQSTIGTIRSNVKPLARVIPLGDLTCSDVIDVHCGLILGVVGKVCFLPTHHCASCVKKLPTCHMNVPESRNLHGTKVNNLPVVHVGIRLTVPHGIIGCRNLRILHVEEALAIIEVVDGEDLTSGMVVGIIRPIEVEGPILDTEEGAGSMVVVITLP